MTALILVAATVGTSWLLGRMVWRSLDAALVEEAETLSGLLDLDHVESLTHAVQILAREKEPGPGKFVQVFGPDGQLVALAGRVPKRIARMALPTGHEMLVRSTTTGRGRYRVAWWPAPDGSWAAVGVLSTRQMHTLLRARVAIGIGAALLLAVLAALAWGVTGRATSELERLAAELETIEAASLDRRLGARHISEVDRLARVLDRLLGRLDQAMSHLRRFTAEAAHELRTPLAALRAHLEVALARPTAEGQRDGLLDALEQTERLARLAEDLLTLSAVEASVGNGARGTVRLDALAREVAESLEPIAQEQGRGFRCEAGVAVQVRGTPELLKRVILNLVDNAFKHTAAAARVEIAVRATDAVAVIEVRDHGSGIPPEEVALVFERFHRGRAARAGAGLGLALCREIVARHRGEIRVASAVGAGTTVTVTLPLAETVLANDLGDVAS